MAMNNALKIVTPNLPAKAIGIIKSATGLSISEIKRRCEEGEFMIEEDLSDDDALLLMMEIAEKMRALDIECEFYQANIVRSPSFMKNVYEAHRDTAQEVDLQIVNEF